MTRNQDVPGRRWSTGSAILFLFASACSSSASAPSGTVGSGGNTAGRGGAAGVNSGAGGVSAGGGGGTSTGAGGTGGSGGTTAGGQSGQTGGAGGGGGSSPDAAAGDVTASADSNGTRDAVVGMPPIPDGTEYTKNGPYPLPPEAAVMAGVPVGTIENHNEGGRAWKLYVPKQYDATKPAAFMVFQDGDLYGSRTETFRGPNVLDNLIAKGDIPVMLAAFIPPGADRHIEYDSLNATYATFVIETILPAVEAKYKITKNPEGRGIGGQSSGGIAAFTVAWERTDQFRRVLTDNGSFTDIRGTGGNRYPMLIREAPVKPIRVTLLSSPNDINGQYGSWLTANVNMAAALKEKGYPYIFMRGDGQHYPPVQAASVFPVHMKWLWFGYVPDGT